VPVRGTGTTLVYLIYGELKFAATYLKSKNNRNIIIGAHTMRDKFLIIKISDWKVAANKGEG